MARSIWKLSIRPKEGGETASPREVTIEADSWQSALAAGRAQLGEVDPLPSDASPIVSATGEVTLVDAATQRSYVLRPAAPDNAANARASSAPPSERRARISSGSLPPVSPALARAHQTLPYSSERAAALEREFAAARHVSSHPPPAEGTRPNLRAVPPPDAAPTPPSALMPRGGSEPPDPLVLLGSRDVERSDETTLTYRERTYLLPGGGERARLEQLLHAKLAGLQHELASRPRGKYVTLAVFDQPPEQAPGRAPLATLEWKDWRGAPLFTAPSSTPASRPPSTPPRPAPPEAAEADARLASAFEAMHDLHFTTTPLAALELAIDLFERLLPCEAYSGSLYDLDTDEFRHVVLRGPGSPERQASASPAHEGLAGSALEAGDEVVVIHHAARDPRFDAAIDGRVGIEVDELAYVPLRQHGQLFGLLQLINRSGATAFSEADVAVLSYVAGQLSRFFAARRGIVE
ncbi:MAG: GAF domain-containing protein [Polyangiales bacterium]